MAKFNMQAYDRLDALRSELAFLREAIGGMGDIYLGNDASFGLFLIISRAEDRLREEQRVPQFSY